MESRFNETEKVLKRIEMLKQNILILQAREKNAQEKIFQMKVELAHTSKDNEDRVRELKLNIKIEENELGIIQESLLRYETELKYIQTTINVEDSEVHGFKK